jgi:hypothetical protein
MKLIKDQKKATITEKSCKKCNILKPIINYCKKQLQQMVFNLGVNNVLINQKKLIIH